jgi:hypothetical protein
MEILVTQKTENASGIYCTAQQHQRILKLEEVGNVSIHVVTDQLRTSICLSVCVWVYQSMSEAGMT